jgi:dolichol-phosphate mannosyltransferase
MATVTVVVPTFNERDNIAILIDRLGTVLATVDAEVLVVDDSRDDTADVALAAGATGRLPVRVIQRPHPVGGLAGAVTEGLLSSEADFVVVMDGDLQHPPELVPELLRVAVDRAQDVVVASRYCAEGQAGGLGGLWRQAVSGASTLLARGLFPARVGRMCTDPMTGFFCVRRGTVDTSRLRPRGFKILLEILALHDLRVAEIPFTFGDRHDGESKASWRNGLHFLVQLGELRLRRDSRGVARAVPVRAAAL